MKRHSTLVVAGWFACAVLAVAVGVGAVNLLGSGITDTAVQPMSETDVERELAVANASSPPPSAAPSAPAESSPAPSGSPSAGAATPPSNIRVFEERAGTVEVSCSGGMAAIDWLAPAQGYEIESRQDGPAEQVSVEFDGDDDEMLIVVGCSGDTPERISAGPAGDDDDGDD
ncbi:hypothetical protein [Allonocardiopsis opalescens]|uniref:Septum formation initiator n=1 Tax=Allonocardiopsis opalescens TaxID=1144618 RepID=A0A2T0PXW0_9ACTN|nr:hypothetical protein [Allonocardiopsis opalescens]PRX96375.1 hypothetical protein CLV72_108384 [Allonocardiopsis opalescens]